MRDRFKLTINEFFIVIALTIACMAFLVSHSVKWYGNYQFWKIDGYASQGTIALNDSTLRVPDSVPYGQQVKYCHQVRSLVTSDESIAIGFIDKQVYCGCLNPENQLAYPIKYKLFKDKIIYQCENNLLETTLIPTSLMGK